MYRAKYTADKYKRDGVECGAVGLRVEPLVVYDSEVAGG